MNSEKGKGNVEEPSDTFYRKHQETRYVQNTPTKRPRRAVRKLTPEQEAQVDAAIRATLDALVTPEKLERVRFHREEGCYPEMKAYRDDLMTKGCDKYMANAIAQTEWLRRNGVPLNIEPDPYTDVDDLPQPRIKHIRRQRPQRIIRRLTPEEWKLFLKAAA